MFAFSFTRFMPNEGNENDSSNKNEKMMYGKYERKKDGITT